MGQGGSKEVVGEEEAVELGSDGEGKPSCIVCAKILHACSDELRLYQIGSHQNLIKDSTCDIHPLLLEACISVEADPAEITQVTVERGMLDETVYLSGQTQADGSKQCRATLYVVSNPPKPGSTKLAVDPEWIDHELPRRWKQACDEQNLKACRQAPEDSWLPRACPIWLIDTPRMCLVRGTPELPYVALSYVWGRTPFFMTKKENIESLQRDHAFENAGTILGVPRTIMDAIEVVRLLDERYLWVDALCIVQDDLAAKMVEINNMAAIYDSATITIVAGQGNDANYGLRGLRNISQPRESEQYTCQISKGVQIVGIRTAHKAAVPWHDRGWTYQEETFSRRRLEFIGDGLSWRCACFSLDEDSSRHDPPTEVPFRAFKMFESWKPRPKSFGELLDGYNRRDFTHPQDVLLAFAGIETALNRSFLGGFVCGMLLMFLDIALCWQPHNWHMESRQASGDQEATAAGLPSWSWAVWKCGIASAVWNCNGEFDKTFSESPTESMFSYRCLSLVDWHIRKWGTTESKPVTRYQRAMSEMRKMGLEDSAAIPGGWSRFKYSYDPEPSIEEKEMGFEGKEKKMDFDSSPPVPWRYYFKHESDPDTEFWHPIPTCYGAEQDLSDLKAGNDLLLCGRTRRAWFNLDWRLPSKSWFAIRDHEGVWVGIMRPMVASTVIDGESGDEDTLSRSLEECELAVISAGYAFEHRSRDSDLMMEFGWDERPKCEDGEKYEYFNVLWVEWVDGIAYRKGCERVMKSRWEIGNGEGEGEVNLMLG